MAHWQAFFSSNRPIILFATGQVFFVLGLAILWQSRRHSRLDLARSLTWLGIFGLTHGLREWGDLFIPIQAAYLDQTWLEVLLLVQPFLLAFSFACLFQFGAETLNSLYPRVRWIQLVPGGLLIMWMTAFVWTSQVSRWNAPRLVLYADVWTRYVLGAPGAMVAAIGLGKQTRQRIQLEGFSHLAPTFYVASLALAVYAVLGGLLVPPAPFFPANRINSEAVIGLTGMPIQVLRSLIGLILAMSIVRGLEIFEMELDRRFEEIQQAQILLAERERIGRELHDGAIQAVYAAGLMAESIRKRIPDDDSLAACVDRVIRALHNAIRDLRSFVIALEPSTASQSLAEGLRGLVKDSQLDSLIQIDISTPAGEDDLCSPTRVAHVLAIVNEALSNVVRHAQARQVWVATARHNGRLHVTVTDDGIGFSGEQVAGFGLRNMRYRARLLGGTLCIEPNPPHGSRLTLDIAWDDTHERIANSAG